MTLNQMHLIRQCGSHILVRIRGFMFFSYFRELSHFIHQVSVMYLQINKLNKTVENICHIISINSGFFHRRKYVIKTT